MGVVESVISEPYISGEKDKSYSRIDERAHGITQSDEPVYGEIRDFDVRFGERELSVCTQGEFGEIYESSRTFAKAKCRCFETHAAHTGTGTRDMDFSID